jgi:hypothetical protein
MVRAKEWTKGMYDLSIKYWTEVIRQKLIEDSPTGDISWYIDKEFKKELDGYINGGLRSFAQDFNTR